MLKQSPKKKVEEHKTVIQTLRLTADEAMAFDRVAKILGKSRTDLLRARVRGLIEKYLKKKKKKKKKRRKARE